MRPRRRHPLPLRAGAPLRDVRERVASKDVIPPHHDPACWGCGDAPGGIRLAAAGRGGAARVRGVVPLRRAPPGGAGARARRARRGRARRGLRPARHLVPLPGRDGSDLRPLPAAVPINTELLVRARLSGERGRRLHADAEHHRRHRCARRGARRASSTFRSSTSSRPRRDGHLLTLGSAGSRTDGHSDGVTRGAARVDNEKRFRQLRRRGKDAARAEAHFRRRRLHLRAHGRGEGRPRAQDHRAHREMRAGSGGRSRARSSRRASRASSRAGPTSRSATASPQGSPASSSTGAARPRSRRRAQGARQTEAAGPSYHGPSTSRPALRVSLSATETPAPGATCSPVTLLG